MSELSAIAARLVLMEDQQILDELEGRTTESEPITFEALRALAGLYRDEPPDRFEIGDISAADYITLPGGSGHVRAGRVEADSSNVAATEWQADGTLTVEFKSGTTWTYEKVPADVVNSLRSARSIGAFFAANIKPKYEGKKIGG